MLPPLPEPLELTPEQRHYIAACVLAARPSRSRATALRMLGVDVDHDVEIDCPPVDWESIEAEARRQGCSVADIAFDRSGRWPDAD